MSLLLFQKHKLKHRYCYIKKASELLKNEFSLKILKNRLSEIKAEAITIAEKWGIMTLFAKKIEQKIKKCTYSLSLT